MRRVVWLSTKTRDTDAWLSSCSTQKEHIVEYKQYYAPEPGPEGKRYYLRFWPDGNFARFELRNPDCTLARDLGGFNAPQLRELATILLTLARYIDPSEADRKRLEDEAKADVEALIASVSSYKE